MGVSFDDLTMDEAVARGMELARAEGYHYAVTPNPELVMRARRDPDYLDKLRGADLALPDGVGIVYAARILGRPLKGRVPGVDFAQGLMDKLADSGEGLFLLGAKPGVAEQAADRLKEQHPGLAIAGTHDGYFTEDAPVAEEIRASGAKVLFVCLGFPKQEEWMARWGPETGTRLAIGLGGSLDVFAGTVRRAPEKWQKLGLEWLYRLIKQPSRLGRMAKLPFFLVQAVWARMRGR